MKSLLLLIGLIGYTSASELKVSSQMNCSVDVNVNTQYCENQTMTETITFQEGKPYFIDNIGTMISVYTINKTVIFDKNGDGTDDYFVMSVTSEANNRYIATFDMNNKIITMSANGFIIIKKID